MASFAAAGAFLPAQARADTKLDYGATSITANAGTTLNLGAITRAPQSTVDFTPLAGATITTTTPNAAPANGAPTILGGYATFDGGETWAVSAAAGGAAGAMSGLNSYSSAFAADANVDVPAGMTTAPAAATVNTLRFAAAGGADLHLTDTLQVAGAGILVAPSFGAAAASFTGGMLTGSASELIVHQYAAGSRLTVGSVIADRDAGTAMNFIKAGPGTVVLSGDNTYSGVTGIFGGTVEVENITNVGAPGTLGGGANVNIGALVFEGGALKFTGATGGTDRTVASYATSARESSIDVARPDGNLTLSGRIIAFGSFKPLLKTGPGTLTLSGTGDNNSVQFTVDAGTLVLAKTSSAVVHAIGSLGYSTVRNGGTIRLAGTGGDQIANRLLVETGGTVDLNGQNETIVQLVGGGTVTSSSGAALRTLGIRDTLSPNGPTPSATVFSGVIEDGSTGKTGVAIGTSGVLRLTGLNTYTGPTTLSGGFIIVGSGGRMGSPGNTADVTIADGGGLTLDVAGISDAATLRITDVSPGSGFAEVTLAAGVSDLIASLVINDKTFGSGVYGSTASGASGNAMLVAAGINPNRIFSGTGTIVVVPEPAVAPGILGLVGLAAVRRRRRMMRADGHAAGDTE